VSEKKIILPNFSPCVLAYCHLQSSESLHHFTLKQNVQQPFCQKHQPCEAHLSRLPGPGQRERETALVGANLLLFPFLKVRINTFKCWQLQIKMSHQKKNPCYIKFLISYWLESSSRRNEKCWTWNHEQRLFQLQVAQQAIIPAKQMQLFSDQL